MYETYFSLTERPFASVPRIDHYFPAAAIEAARNTLLRCIQRAEGVAVVIGPSGTGKTLLCHVLAEQFKTALQVAMLSGGYGNSRRTLLQAILFELDQPYRGLDEGELRLALEAYVTRDARCDRGVLLLIDEAHHLPLKLLDELHVLTNLMRNGQPAVRLVLAGSRELEERFSSPRLESFSQRTAARCYLEAFQRLETQDYIHARIAAAGGQGAALFSPETCQSIQKATDGVPRLINQLCDHAMLLAFAAGRGRIDPAHVEEAWADLQQLPTPWNEPAQEPAAVIEFGSLEDDPGASEPAAAVGPTVSPESPTVPMLRVAPEAGPADAELELIDSGPSSGEAAVDDADFRAAGSIGADDPLPADPPDQPFEEQFAEEELITDRYAPPEKGGAKKAAAAATRPAAATVAQSEDPQIPTVPLCGSRGDEVFEPEDPDMIVVEEGYESPPSWPARNVVAVRRHEYGRLFAKLRRGF